MIQEKVFVSLIENTNTHYIYYISECGNNHNYIIQVKDHTDVHCIFFNFFIGLRFFQIKYQRNESK